MTYGQTISLLARQLQEANATISRQAETIAQQQHALAVLDADLRQLRASLQPATATFPRRALRYGAPA